MKINNLIKIFLVSLCFSVLLTATPCFAGHMEGADGSVVTTSGKTMSAASGDCEAVASLQKKWEGCIFCVLYKALFVAAKSVGAASSKLSDNLLQICLQSEWHYLSHTKHLKWYPLSLSRI